MSMVHCEECDREISSLAEFCPHCGRPTSVKKSISYSILLGRKNGSSFARYLKGLAVAVAIVGIIMSILAANVKTINYYGKETTTFSFSIFLTNLLTYVEGVFVLWSLGTVVELIQDTHDMVAGMKLNRTESGPATSSTPSASAAPQYIPSNPVKASKWQCKKCGASNSGTDMYCEVCHAFNSIKNNMITN